VQIDRLVGTESGVGSIVLVGVGADVEVAGKGVAGGCGAHAARTNAASRRIDIRDEWRAPVGGMLKAFSLTFEE